MFCGGMGSGKGRTKFPSYSAFDEVNLPEYTKFYSFEPNTFHTIENVIYGPYHNTKIIMTMILYLYIIFLFSVVSLSLLCTHSFSIPTVRYPSMLFFRGDFSFSLAGQINVAYLYLLSYILLRSFCLQKHPIPIITQQKSCSRFTRLMLYLILYLLLLNFLLIGISNPSILNPGPNLKVFHQNVQGLIPFSELDKSQPRLNEEKIRELNTYININKPDIVVLNETWLKKSILDREVIENDIYELFRNDRDRISHPPDPDNPKRFRRYGGGVLIAIRSDLKAEYKNISVRKGAEIKAIEVTIDEKKFVFCSVYRVGTLGEDNYHSFLNTVKSFYKIRNTRKIFIIGDMNLREVSWPVSDGQVINSRIERLFVDSFDELGLDQCITVPTHDKGRTLDVLVTNSKPLVSNLLVLEKDSVCKSDHFPVTFQVKTNVKHQPAPKRKIYNFKKANWNELNETLKNVPWNEIINNREPEQAWCNLKTLLFRAIDMHIPTITIKSTFSPPWFDSECFEFYREKERAHRRKKQNCNVANELDFSVKRRQFKNLCDQKLRDNMYNYDDPELITKKLWSHVKSKSNCHRIPECIHRSKTYRNKSSEKAELFNSFFYDQFSESSIYNIDIDWSNDHIMNEISFDYRRIEKLLFEINPNKASGPDGIYGTILKNCAKSLALPLSIIFETSYNAGLLPTEWKSANIVPIHKKGPKDDVENYRPVSLTCLVMKIFERLIKVELLNKTSHFLDVRQHGFLSQKSCTTNMIGFTDNVVLSINDCNTMSTDVIYFDFSKAFDSVNHDIILYKLKHFYEIDGRLLKFLRNYLCERKQCVILENVKSSYKDVLSGVPQGSILGPILFVLFINDMPQGIDPGSKLALYADDTKLWRKITCDEDIIKLQDDIGYLHKWAELNKMKFHPQKCKVVSVHSKPSPLSMLPFVTSHYHLGNNLLAYADSEKDLGILINKKLNFNEHCEQILSKANQKYGLLRRTCNFVNDTQRKRILYLTLVRSQFEHCSQIWNPQSETMLAKFEAIQKKCIKWILSEEELSYRSHDVYIRKCKQVKILPLRQRFKVSDLVLFHKIFNKLISEKLPDYLSLFTGNRRLRSCHLDRLSFVSTITPKGNTCSLLKKSFFYRTHLLWNSLPLDIKEIVSPNLFKDRLVQYLWNIETNNEMESYDDFDYSSSESIT